MSVLCLHFSACCCLCTIHVAQDLPIRSAAESDASFIPLSIMVKMWEKIDQGVAPPGFAPGSAVSASKLQASLNNLEPPLMQAVQQAPLFQGPPQPSPRSSSMDMFAQQPLADASLSGLPQTGLRPLLPTFNPLQNQAIDQSSGIFGPTLSPGPWGASPGGPGANPVVSLQAWLPPPSAPPPSQSPRIPAGVSLAQPLGNEALRQQQPSMWGNPAPLLNTWSNPMQPGQAPNKLQAVQHPPAWGLAPSLRPVQEPQPVVLQQQEVALRQTPNQQQSTGLSNMAAPLQQLFDAVQRASVQQDPTPQPQEVSASPAFDLKVRAEVIEPVVPADRQEPKIAPWAAVATKGDHP